MQSIQPHREAAPRSVIWDPSPTPSTRFIAGHGSSINLYDWLPKQAEIRIVASHPFQNQQDPSVLKCLAWSPHSAYNDLVAAGSTTGRLQLIRLNAVLSSIHDPANTLSTPSVINISSRMTRPCNVLAFSPHDPNYLAVGTVKSRGDPGLTVYDIENAATALPASRISPANAKPHNRPSERVTARQATADQRGEARIIFTHGITEAVTSLAFLPQTPTTLIIGAASKCIRVIDMRQTPPTSTGSQQVLTKHHSGICIDPFDEIKLASFGEDAAVRIWDRRYLSSKGTPLLCFTEADSGAVGGRNPPLAHIAFSPIRRGILGSLGSDDNPVRLWTLTAGHYVEDEEDDMLPVAYRRTDSISRASPRLERSYEKYIPPTLVQSQGCVRPRHVASFCFATCMGLAQTSAPHVLTVSKDGVLHITAVPSPPHHLWSSRGQFAISHDEELDIRHSKKPDDPKEDIEPWDLVVPEVTDTLELISHSKGNSLSTTANTDESRVGRSPQHQPLRGVGFPPFPVIHPESSLTASRPPKASRNFSPSYMRRFKPDKRTGSRTPGHSPVPSPTSITKPLPSQEWRREDRRRKSTSSHVHHHPEELDVLSPSRIENLLVEERKCFNAMREDISMVMRRRLLRGYSLKNAIHNAHIALDDPVGGDILSNVWWTLAKFMQTLQVSGVSRVNGFDFSYQGLFGVWEGIPRSETVLGQASDLGAALHLEVVTGGDGSRSSGHRSHRSSLTLQRRDGPVASTTHTAPTPSNSTQAEFDSAVDQLNDRRVKAENTAAGVIKLGYPSLEVKTQLSGRRKLALALCDWDLNRDEFVAALKGWENSGFITRAACWATLMQEYDLAGEFLMRSKDDYLHVISGTVSALLASKNAPGLSVLNPWLEQCQRMINGISDPYIRIMLSHLIDEPWDDILQDDAVRLNDRLGIIFRFLEDDKVSSALHKTFENAKREGELDGLVFTGLTPQGMDILQAYVDRTGDVQTAAILASYVCPARFKDGRVERWVSAYQDLLDSWELFHFRCEFDIERGRMLQHLIQAGEIQPFEWVERQLYIRCNNCNKVVNSRRPLTEPMVGANPAATPSDRGRTNSCPHCGNTLARCVVCLMPLGMLQDTSRETELVHETRAKDTIDDAVVFCQTCRHGGHASHIFDWFFSDNGRSHPTCAVADCDCRCADL